MAEADFQWFPTPAALARRAWDKFQNKHITRLLEPSAGRGDLLLFERVSRDCWRSVKVDCIELDLRHHATLRERGFTVVGTDFLLSQNLAHYSHILMNPPFASGAAHVLRAWHGLFDGEVVAILNAETVRNPFSAERQELARLIDAHGSVEFIEGAFSGAERATDVEVALVHLRKTGEADNLVSAWVGGLKEAAPPCAEGWDGGQQLALPRAEVENLVIAFNAAVEAAQESIIAGQRKAYYTALLGQTLAEMQGGGPKPDAYAGRIQSDLGDAIRELRERAWTAVLHRSSLTQKLSSSAQERVQAEFAKIGQLDFTAPNICAFMLGVVESQGQIQIEMACDVFDAITRYHTENRVWYRGWKSNDSHRTAGMRIKCKRFVLPCRSYRGMQGQPGHEFMRGLMDIDKVFCMLDGKALPMATLSHAFETQWSRLRTAERVSTEYFDIRFYVGVGTVHFYPRRQDLMDRLNRVVGLHRLWLPPADQTATNAFWQQFDEAEVFAKDVEPKMRRRDANAAHGDFAQDFERERANQAIDQLLERAHEAAGITGVFAAIERAPAPLLLEAA